MTRFSELPEQPKGEPPSRRGRKPEPISENAGMTHRGWLEPVRTRLFASGLTLDELVNRSGYSKTRISELLRGNGYYPAWEITFSVIQVLGIPAWPMRRLWTAAAREARKKQDWIDRCIQQVPRLPPDVPPLDHQGFTEAMHAPYSEFARAFLLTDQRAARLFAETSDILWLCWDEALVSANVHRYAWNVLRTRVMARAPHHPDGHPELRPAAFSTVAQERIDDFAARFAQIGESMTLFDAISRLPHNQLDVIVLRYLCGMDEASTANVLGVLPAIAHAFDRHAHATLRAARPLRDDPPGVTAS